MKKLALFTLVLSISSISYSQVGLSKLGSKAKSKVDKKISDKKKEKEDAARAAEKEAQKEQERQKREQEKAEKEEAERKAEEERLAAMTPKQREKEEIRKATIASPAQPHIQNLQIYLKGLKKKADKYTDSSCFKCHCSYCINDIESVQRFYKLSKEGDPDFKYLPRYKKEMEELITLVENKSFFVENIHHIVYVKDLSKRFKDDPYKLSLLEKLDRNRTDSIVKATEDKIVANGINPADEYHIANLKKDIKFFYENEASKNFGPLKEELEENYKKASFWSDENRATKEFDERVNSRTEIKYAYHHIATNVRLLENATSMVPNDQEINQLKAKNDKLYSEIRNFIDSGGFDKLIERKRYEELAAVRMKRAKNTNGSLVAMVKKGVNAELETGESIKRVSIEDATWYIRKNNYGIPLAKVMQVSIAVKLSDGRCYITNGTLSKTYEGSTGYGPTKFYYAGPHKHEEILCENVFK